MTGFSGDKTAERACIITLVTSQMPNQTLLSLAAFSLITGFAFEAMATTNAMPAVMRDLGDDAWFSLAAGVTLAGQIMTTVFTGWLCDRFGVGRPLLFGVCGFILGSTLAGLAPNLWVFVVARLVQGLGIGFTIVPLYVMIGALVPAEVRPKLFASFSYAWIIPSMVGPAIAGYVVNAWHWRPVFLLVLPLTLLGSLPLVPLVKRMPVSDFSEGATDSSPHVESASKPPVLATVATAAAIVLWQLAGGTTGFASSALSVVGVACFSYGIINLFPAETFRAAPGIGSMYATRFLLMATMIGTEFFIPLILERIHGWDLQSTGLVLTLGTVTWTLGSFIQSRVTRQAWRIKLPFLGAVSVFAGALLLLVLPFSGAPVYPALIGWAVIGTGMGLMTATISDLSLAITEQARHGEVSSKLQVADAAGPAVATGLFGMCLSLWGQSLATTSWGLPYYLPAPVLAIVLAGLAVLAARRNRGLVLAPSGK